MRKPRTCILAVALAVAVLLTGACGASQVSEPPNGSASGADEAKADAAKEAATKDLLTAEEARSLSDRESELLLTCQMAKYVDEVGKKKAMDWFMDGMEEAAEQPDGEPIISAQEELIREKGISCAYDEIYP